MLATGPRIAKRLAAADLVFARAGLLEYCSGNSIPCLPFSDFRDLYHGLSASLSQT